MLVLRRLLQPIIETGRRKIHTNSVNSHVVLASVLYSKLMKLGVESTSINGCSSKKGNYLQ